MRSLLFILFSISAFAQKGISVKGGLSVNNNEMGKSQIYVPSGRASFYGGLSYQFRPNDFAFQAELQYTHAGSKGSYNGSDAQLNLKTANLLVTADYYTKENLSLKVGVYSGYIFDAKLDYVGTSINYNKAIKDIDFGLVLGSEYSIYKGLYIDGKVLVGLIDLNNVKPDGGSHKIKNRLFQIGLGYRFM